MRGPRNTAFGWLVHGRPSISISGMTGSASNTGRLTVPDPSAIGVTIFIADQSPDARLIATA